MSIGLFASLLPRTSFVPSSSGEVVDGIGPLWPDSAVAQMTWPPKPGPKEGVRMARRKHTPEQVIKKLRQAEVAMAEGSTVAQASRKIGVTEQTFYRWRAEYGGLRIDQARRLKQLETENGRLRRAVADLTLDNQILKEAAQGNF